MNAQSLSAKSDNAPSPASSSIVSQRGLLEFTPRTVVIASVIAAVLIAVLGVVGDISLGDENAHIRTVRAYVKHRTRVPRDPTFAGLRRRPLAFAATPLWHVGLAVLWGGSRSESQTIAQAYHACFYLLLLLAVYFGTRRIWDPVAASWAWLLVATVPMVCAYSMLLYQDVPGIAVTALAMLLLWRKNFLLSGVCMAMAYMTKMNVLSYALWAVIFAAWWAGGTWKRRAFAASCVAIPVAIAFGCDMYWRWSVYGAGPGPWSMSGGLMGSAAPAQDGLTPSAMSAMRSLPTDYVVWKPYTVTSFRSLVSSAGVALLAAMLLAPFLARDAISKWLWACLCIALVGFVAIFVVWSQCMQMRYLLPVCLALIMLCGKALQRIRLPLWLRVAIVGGCVLQAAAASAYVSYARRISKEDANAYAWIREHTEKHVAIMFPEEALTNQTDRVFIWFSLNPPFFMAEATEEQQRELLDHFGVSYIAVPLRRVYDRHEEGAHAGGYTQEFVESLDNLPWVEKVYANAGFLIFRVIPRRPDSRPGSSPRREQITSRASWPADKPGR